MTHFAGALSNAPGLISVTGADAGSFLRAQLTNDVMRLGPDRHFLAAWCDAKGRVVLVTRVVDNGDGYLLVVPRVLIDAILNRLRLYVLRAKVNLHDVSASYRIDGLRSAGLPPLNHCEHADGRITLGLPAGEYTPGRAVVISPGDSAAPADALRVDAPNWQMGAIDAGVPVVYPTTQGLFVPQMLNLHWLMAVDFDKGCYPGQEVIARLHYRGRLTRRLFRLAWSGGDQPTPGDAVVDAEGAQQGTVVRAATDQPTQGRLLAVLKIESINASLRTGAAALELLDLPYPTPQ